jgi:septal ring factor EnvC (AmiA/AmiB activator)
MHVLRPFILLAAIASLAGCAVTAQECDPRNADAGFATKFGCNTQGVYAQRVDEKETVLLDEQKTNQLFRDVYAAIEQEQASIGSDLKTQQRQYASVNKSLGALLSELKSRAKGNQRIEAEIASVENELNNLNQQDNPAVLQKQHELQKLRSKVTSLESDLGL